MYEIRKDKPFYYSLRLLKMLRFYPQSYDGDYKKRFFVSFVIWNIIFGVPWITLISLHLAVNLIKKAEVDLTEDIGDIFGDVGAMLCCIFMSVHFEKWSLMFQKLSDFKNFGKPPQYEKAQRTGNLISKVTFLYGVLGITAYVGISLLDSKRCHRMNAEKNLHEVCGTLSPAWWPNGDQIGFWAHTFLLTMQIVSGMIYLTSSFVLNTIPLEGYGLIISMIHHLKEQIIEIMEIENENEQEKRIKKMISYHQYIIQLSEDLNAICKVTIGHVYLIAALVIGCLGNQLLHQSTPKALAFIIAYSVAMFYSCHAGQNISDESMSIGDAVYNSNWYEAKPKIRKYLVLMILRSQKPIKVDALPLGTADYPFYLMMLKTSYTYLTLLNETV
ncbi:hypothetical protein GWI33_021989 [Rhynchophorus ferrugineus]|uniref:Odorant receptor n=1 Tax=Rhynchophorus ferrugineus TaxID=354439 RepID=A0A834IQS0_RHYFE|nr:hypothetical protein GWI33_021989 [Rhynchophorus ferrugineus]